MTVRLAAVLAMILSAIGIGVVCGAAFLVDAVLSDAPEFAGSLLWCSLTLVGFFLILLGLLTFFAMYLTNRRRSKEEE